jgi:hypothetical protein
MNTEIFFTILRIVRSSRDVYQSSKKLYDLLVAAGYFVGLDASDGDL